jgi:hypothetical protein
MSKRSVTTTRSRRGRRKSANRAGRIRSVRGALVRAIDAVGGFIIMLDDELEVFAQHWPIRAQAADIDTLRRQRQFDGNPTLVARASMRVELRENKSLVNARTGRVHTGGIYARLS